MITRTNVVSTVCCVQVTDPFGTGSFVLSPSDPPQLPPKQRKAPAPPRPPAPRPAGPGHADPFAGDDPFDGNGRNATAATSSLAVKSDPFASFADFSPSKVNSCLYLLFSGECYQ